MTFDELVKTSNQERKKPELAKIIAPRDTDSIALQRP